MKARHKTAISIAAVLLVLIIWQLSSSLALVDKLLLPAPDDIMITLQELLFDGYRQIPLLHHILISAGRALFAFTIAIIIGVPIGILMGISPITNAIIEPFVQFLRPIPKIALIPLVIVWLGIGESAKFFLIFIATLLSIIVGASAATLNLPSGLLRAAQTLGANRKQIIYSVVFPYALPEIFTSIRLSIGVGWTSLIAAEMVAANSGLGWMIINAGNYLRTDVVILGILLLGIIGYLFDWVLVKLQYHFVFWSGKNI